MRVAWKRIRARRVHGVRHGDGCVGVIALTRHHNRLSRIVWWFEDDGHGVGWAPDLIRDTSLQGSGSVLLSRSATQVIKFGLLRLWWNPPGLCSARAAVVPSDGCVPLESFHCVEEQDEDIRTETEEYNQRLPHKAQGPHGNAPPALTGVVGGWSRVVGLILCRVNHRRPTLPLDRVLGNARRSLTPAGHSPSLSPRDQTDPLPTSRPECLPSTWSRSARARRRSGRKGQGEESRCCWRAR